MYDYFYGAEADQFSFYRIPKLDPDTKLPMLDADGKPITEEKEISIINNGSKQQEPEKKPSILEKLRQPLPERTPKTTAPKKSAEMEI